MTPKERAARLINNGNFWQKPAYEMAGDIEDEITAAVLEERRACAEIATNAALNITPDAINTRRNQIEWARDRTANAIAAAIRARGKKL